MKMLIWKELREHRLAFLLGFICLSIAEIYVLSGLIKNFQAYDGSGEFTLNNPSYLQVIEFGSFLLAAALGFVQFQPEQSRDRWAQLLHRPVSRSVIFLSKVLAGAILYFSAMLLVLAVAVGYVTLPGIFPVPFFPEMLWDSLGLVGAGFSGYLVTVLVILHRGRWFGTRGLIVLVALSSLIFSMIENSFYYSAGTYVTVPDYILLLIFLLAAWGEMLSNGKMQRRNWITRTTLVCLIFMGLQVLASLINTVATLTLGGVQFGSYYSDRFGITKDGQILICKYTREGESLGNYDLQGNKITDPKYTGNTTLFLQSSWSCFIYPNYDYLLWQRRAPITYWSDTKRRENWYRVNQRNYFIGYDDVSRLCVGIFDRDGFKPPGAIPQPFLYLPQNSQRDYFFPHNHVFWVGQDLYQYDFEDRKMDRIYQAEEPIVSAGALDDKPFGKAFYLLVALPHSLVCLDLQGHPVFQIPYLHNPQKYPFLDATLDPIKNIFYIDSRSAGSVNGKTPPDYMEAVDIHGNVVQSATLLGEIIPAGKVSLVVLVYIHSTPISVTYGTQIYNWLFPAPLPDDPDDIQPPPNRSAILRNFVYMWSIALLSGLITYGWARRAGFPHRAARNWAIFAFAAGPLASSSFV